MSGFQEPTRDADYLPKPIDSCAQERLFPYIARSTITALLLDTLVETSQVFGTVFATKNV